MPCARLMLCWHSTASGPYRNFDASEGPSYNARSAPISRPVTAVPDAIPTTTGGPVLVSDFDGTMTRHDFYKLAIEKLLPADVPDYWAEYRAGTITHFEALRRYFAAIRKTEDEILAVVRQMELDPGLKDAVESLRQAGWSVIVTSAGCEWYIRRLLADAGVNIAVHANPGRFESGRGLVMEMPVGSPYLSQSLGVDKTAVVRQCVAAVRQQRHRAPTWTLTENENRVSWGVEQGK